MYTLTISLKLNEQKIKINHKLQLRNADTTKREGIKMVQHKYATLTTLIVV